MKIMIEEVLDPTRRYVRFRCAYGSGLGYWMGEEISLTGNPEHVELEVQDPVLHWSERVPSESHGPAIRWKGDILAIDGMVEGVAEDGVIQFRVGSDVLLLEQGQGLADVTEGMNIELEVSRLELYPRDL
jgi:hypothetical protein